MSTVDVVVWATTLGAAFILVTSGVIAVNYYIRWRRGYRAKLMPVHVVCVALFSDLLIISMLYSLRSAPPGVLAVNLAAVTIGAIAMLILVR